MNIFVANFDQDTDEEDLEVLFGNFGTVTDVNIWINSKTGESAGYGFVTISDDSGAERAIEELDGLLWNGRRLKVSKARHQI